MDNVNKVMVAFFLFLCLSINFGVGDESDSDEEETIKKMPTNIIDAAKRLYSLPTTPSHSWFLHPNLDFRVGSSGTCSSGKRERDKEGEGKEEEEGATSVGGKVKDAVVKSLDNTKAALQHSANSAADTLNNLAQTL